MAAALGGGCYTFFMGLHPNSPFLHAMYCQLIAQHLERHGLAEEPWARVVPAEAEEDAQWAGVRCRYWSGHAYLLPSFVMRPDAAAHRARRSAEAVRCDAAAVDRAMALHALMLGSHPA